MDVMPKELVNILNKMGIADYSILSQNAEKGRYNVCVNLEGENFILKWNDPAILRGQRALEKEIMVYKALKDAECVPKRLVDECLITKYISNGKTFRECLLSSNDKKEFEIYIDCVLKAYLEFLGKLNEYDLDLPECYQSHGDQCRKFLSKAIYSGPYLSKKYCFEKIRNCLIRKIFLDRKKINYQSKTYIMHGDFHLNNIIISNQNAYIIDLEDTTYGNVNIELAYFYSRVWILICGQKDWVEILDNKIERVLESKFFDKSEFWQTVQLYCRATLLNRRVHKNEQAISFLNVVKQWNDINSH